MYVDSLVVFNFDVQKMEIYVSIKMSMREITFISCRILRSHHSPFITIKVIKTQI